MSGDATLGSGVFNVLDYGATGDGTTDDTIAIQAAIDACEAAGGGTVLFPALTYNIDTGLTIDGDNVRILGRGRDSTKIITDSTSTTIWMFTITGDNTEFSDIWITNGPAVDLVSASPASSGSEGLVTFYGTSPTQADGLTVRNCKFDGINTDGFAIEYVKNVLVDGCIFTDINHSAFGIRDTCDDVRIVNCDFTDIVCTGAAGTNRYFVHNGADESVVTDPTNDYFIKNFIVDGCTFVNNPVWEALDTHGGEYIQFTNNIIRDCYQGIHLVNSFSGGAGEQYVTSPALNHVVCSGNTIDMSSLSTKSYGIIIRGNFYPNAAAAVYPYGNSNVVVSNNTLIGCGNPTENHQASIVLEFATGTVIEGNTIEDFVGYAVVLYQYCNGCMIHGNTIRNAEATTEDYNIAIGTSDDYNGDTVPNYVFDNYIIDDCGEIDYAFGERGGGGSPGTDVRLFNNHLSPYASDPFDEFYNVADTWVGQRDINLAPISEPSEPREGQIYYDSTEDAPLVYNGSSFNAMWNAHRELSDSAYDDLVITGNDFVNGPTAPSWTTSWITNTNVLDFAQGDNVYFEGMQLPHGRTAASDLLFHVHFSPLSDITDGETIIWSLDYTVTSPYGVYPATSNITTTFTNNSTTRGYLPSAALSSGGTGTTILASAKPHLLTTSTSIDGSSLTLSAVLAGLLEFDSSSRS
jgi:hypothetical protein